MNRIKYSVNSKQITWKTANIVYTTNFAVDSTRTAVVNGRKHLVVSGCAIESDSVMNGILYPADVVEANYSKLDNVIAPLGHPMLDGEFVSAKEPLAINTNHIGAFVRSPKLAANKAIVDIYIDEAVAMSTKHGERLVNAINKKEKIGLSTGLFVEFNKDQDHKIATNFDVDHLAILLDEAPAGANTYITNEGKKLDKSLFINCLSAILSISDTQKEALLQINAEQDLANALADIAKPKEIGLTDEEIEKFSKNKELLNNHLESVEADKTKIVEEVSSSTGISVNSLQSMSFADVEKLHSAIKKTVNNQARSPAPSKDSESFTMLEGS